MTGKTRVLVVVVALLLGIACEGGTGGSGEGTPPFNQGPANVGCTVRVDYPHQSKHVPTNIAGKVGVTCVGATIDSLTVDVHLERSRKGRAWETLQDSARSNRIAPAAPGTYELVAEFPCSEARDGDKFRTAGRGSGVFGGKPAGKVDWKVNPKDGVKIACR